MEYRLLLYFRVCVCVCVCFPVNFKTIFSDLLFEFLTAFQNDNFLQNAFMSI